MGTTVSRRLVFVKMKRKQPPPKPKPPIRDDDTLVGEAAIRSSSELVSRPCATAVMRGPAWIVVGAWVAGLCILVGIVVAFISLGDTPSAQDDAVHAAGNQSASSGYNRAATGEPGTTGGAGHSYGAPPTARGFLNAPFPRHR